LPKVDPNGAITQSAPPRMLPSVTGIRFFIKNWLTVISAPRSIPKGIICAMNCLWECVYLVAQVLYSQMHIDFVQCKLLV
jgi:hypothetical protein